jgi:WD40 repeat protein
MKTEKYSGTEFVPILRVTTIFSFCTILLVSCSFISHVSTQSYETQLATPTSVSFNSSFVLPTQATKNRLIFGKDGKYTIGNLQDSSSVPLESTLLQGDSAPVFSPDGSEIIFGGRDGDIYRQSLNGTPPINMTNSGFLDENPVFTPDGSGIVFESMQKSVRGLNIVNGDGGDPRVFLQLDEEVRRGNWSADGQSFVFWQLTLPQELQEGVTYTPKYSIGILNILSGEITTIFEDGQENISKPAIPLFSPTDSNIVFQGIIKGKLAIFSIQPDGTGLKRVSQEDGKNYSNPVWSPDGKEIAVTVSDDSIYAAILDLNGNTLRQFDPEKGVISSWAEME